jgi:hypothetical protein
MFFHCEAQNPNSCYKQGPSLRIEEAAGTSEGDKLTGSRKQNRKGWQQTLVWQAFQEHRKNQCGLSSPQDNQGEVATEVTCQVVYTTQSGQKTKPTPRLIGAMIAEVKHLTSGVPRQPTQQ